MNTHSRSANTYLLTKILTTEGDPSKFLRDCICQKGYMSDVNSKINVKELLIDLKSRNFSPDLYSMPNGETDNSSLHYPFTANM
jgi:hypothetical protein